MLHWKKLSEQTKPIGYRTLVSKTFQLPDGTQKEFSTYDKPGAQGAAVIALTPEGRVVIARQFRPGPEKILDELPGGEVDPDESPATAAGRELLEETGYQAKKLEYLGPAYRDAYSNATTHYFIGYECSKIAEPALEPGEHVEVTTISIAELLDNAHRGKLTDAPAVLLAYDRLLSVKSQ